MSAKTHQRKEGTKVKELRDLAAIATDFTETDIVKRNAKNGLLKKE